MSTDNLHALILAAGKSTRMKSEKSKVIHEILGKPIIEYVVDALSDVPVTNIAVVVGEHNVDDIKEVLGERVEYIIQKEALGTGHAVIVAEDWLKKRRGDVFVVVGDAPFITAEIMRDLHNLKAQNQFNCTFLTAVYENPPPYGRIVRDEENRVLGIIEEKDASPEQKKIKEVSSSHYCFEIEYLLAALKNLHTKNAQNEYYLTDVIEIFAGQNLKVETMPIKNPVLTFGVNNREDMAHGIAFLKDKINRRWMRKGVTIIDSSTTFIESPVEIESDTIIYPFTYLAGKTKIGNGSQIGPFVYLDNDQVPAGSKIKNNVSQLKHETY